MNTRTWDAEQEISADTAAAVIGSQMPLLASARVEPMASGWDNTVFVVNGTWAFRFPRRAVAVPGLQREIACLPTLAQRLPLPVPVPEYVGVACADYPWPFYGARLLPGRELADADVGDAARETAAEAVGDFLRALHDPATVSLLPGDLPQDPWGRSLPHICVPKACTWLGRLVDRRLWRPDPAVTELCAAALRLGAPARQPVVVHGDLHIRHLLFNEERRLSGVIDWGDICKADPAVDLAVAYSAFEGRARARLLETYGGIDEDCALRARVVAIFLHAALAEYAADVGQESLLREALSGLRRAIRD